MEHLNRTVGNAEKSERSIFDMGSRKIGLYGVKPRNMGGEIEMSMLTVFIVGYVVGAIVCGLTIYVMIRNR